uniref:Sodium/hydrogen exchanger n=1 Tax=Caenorhabditis japonica TaxID=281687 RepID=A0A8R1HX98_CAEJA
MSARLISLLLLLVCYATADVAEKEAELGIFRLFTWKWNDVNQIYVITTWLLIASLAKILFNCVKPLSQYLPDSSLLIIVGLALGYLLRKITLSGTTLDSHVFFLYLLPPIIFDAGYFMPNRSLFKNFDSVLVFSVVGTIWNTFAIGGSLLLMTQYGMFTMSFNTFEILVFSALISAVDPVAVIAVFEEIHVNEFLFINVFGEALFNDGVTVASGAADGSMTHPTRFSIAVCGMLMKQYIKGNITPAAINSVKYFTKMLAQCSETVIFMFLGLSTISSEHHFDLNFVCATLFFCLIYRAIGIVAQCYVLNKFRAKKFELVDQFIMSYGGLRGAIAYGLVVSMPASIAAKPMFVTTTIAVIYFTVFLQGVTIKPLVHLLKIKRKEQRELMMVEIVYNKYLDYMMSGVEDIAGQRGHYSFIENFEHFNAKVIKPVLMRHETRQSFDATSIVRAYEKITLADAIKMTTTQNLRLEILKKEHKVAPVGDEDKKELQLKTLTESGENFDQLYTLFSDLLDKKLNELQRADAAPRRRARRLSSEDDIQDDYMQEVGSRTHTPVTHRSAEQLPSDRAFYRGRRQSTGDLKGKRSDFNV